MSDDDEYYEWEEEYLFEDPVPDLVVSENVSESKTDVSRSLDAIIASCRHGKLDQREIRGKATDTISLGRTRRIFILRGRPLRRSWH